MAYEILRDSYVTQAETTSPVRDMIAGATAGGFGTFMTNGLDVIKTRLQIEPELYGGSVLRCTQMALDEAGPAVFMRGMVPRLMHKIPANGFFFVFFEFYRRLLRCEGAHDVKGASTEEKR
jgi:solute carrier family 25 S-adenosylmethionine transporter 26